MAAILKPHMRIYLAEPALCEPVLHEFGLALADAPTAIAYDTMASYGGDPQSKWRMTDLFASKAATRSRRLDVAMLTAFVVAIAKGKTKLSSARLAQLAAA